MSNAILEVGEKVHVITRRLFLDDVRRHFAGVIHAVNEHAFRAEGYVFVFNSGTNQYQRRTPVRMRVFSISDGNIINVISPEVDLHKLEYQVVDGRLMVIDSRNFALDINEFGATA